MPGKDTIEAEGTVTSVEPNGVVWVTLANNHRVLGYRAARLRSAAVRLVPGDRVAMEMSPFDLSKGRIILKVQQEDL